MPVLDRQSPGPMPTPTPGRIAPSLQASVAGSPPRSVPETRPTPLQRSYVPLSVVALVCGFVAITALELGIPPGSPLVRLCVLVGAPILVVTTLDASLRIWRSAWAWMPVDRAKGLFRLSWLLVASIGIVAVVAASVAVLAP